MNMLKKNRFAIENMHPFEGYHRPGDQWNGWEKPYFEWDEALKIVEWINDWTGTDQLRVDNDNHLIVSIEDPEAPFDIEATAISTEDGTKSLYPVGTGWWIWSIHEDYY